MAWIRGLCLQIHLLSVTWGCFRLLLLWQCRSCLQLSPQHWSCSKASCKTSLGQHWGKYLTCPAPEHGYCGAGGSQGSWAGMPAQGAPSVSVPWGRLCPGAHEAMATEGCPVKGAPVLLARRHRGLGAGTLSAGHGPMGRGPAPRSELARVSPKHSGSGAGWKPGRSSPASPSPRTPCLAPRKHHGLRSPSCGSRDKWPGQHELSGPLARQNPEEALQRQDTALRHPTCPA